MTQLQTTYNTLEKLSSLLINLTDQQFSMKIETQSNLSVADLAHEVLTHYLALIKGAEGKSVCYEHENNQLRALTVDQALETIETIKLNLRKIQVKKPTLVLSNVTSHAFDPATLISSSIERELVYLNTMTSKNITLMANTLMMLNLYMPEKAQINDVVLLESYNL